MADEDVVGFEVAMDELGGVGGCEAASGLAIDGEGLAPAARGSLLPGAEGEAVDELHGDEDLAAREHADVVDGDDIGVGEAGHRLGLAQESGGAGGFAVAGSAAVDELDGDLAVELGVVGGVDDAHAAGAEALEDDVASEQFAARELVGADRAVGLLGRVAQGRGVDGHGRGQGVLHRLAG